MHHQKTGPTRIVVGAMVFALAAGYGCERDNPYKLQGDGNASSDCNIPDDQTSTTGATSGGSTPTTGSSGSGNNATPNTPEVNPNQAELDARVLDYSEALRTASLKLLGTLPDLEEIYELHESSEADRPGVYEQMVDEMLNDPRFHQRIIAYYRTVFKMGGAAVMSGQPSRETAPTFAARLLVEGKDWRQVLTATSNTCPTYDMQNKEFVDGECNNGVTPSGILSDPGVHSLYFGNLAMRRNRFFHETFLCVSGNAPGAAEPTKNPSTEGPCGEAPPPGYVSPWPMTALAGDCNGGRVDFHEYNDSVVCANCHATWNHRAPLFGEFDENGMHQGEGQFEVEVPVEGSPNAVRTDWLPDGEPYAWKFGVTVANLTEMGQRMSEDNEVITCAVKRIYNYAMSRGDIVINDAKVPDKIVTEFVTDFKANGYNLKETLRAVLLSDDFVRF